MRFICFYFCTGNNDTESNHIVSRVILSRDIQNKIYNVYSKYLNVSSLFINIQIREHVNNYFYFDYIDFYFSISTFYITNDVSLYCIHKSIENVIHYKILNFLFLQLSITKASKFNVSLEIFQFDQILFFCIIKKKEGEIEKVNG